MNRPGRGVRKGKAAPRPGLPVWWSCLACPEHGEGDGGAAAHTDATHHGTMTTTRPPEDSSAKPLCGDGQRTQAGHVSKSEPPKESAMTYQHNPADQQADEVCGIARQADGSGRGLPCVEGGTVHLVRDHPAPVAHKAMSLEHDAKDGSWTLTTHHALTDAEAAALTFQAYPAQVRMGAFVAITDLDGTRIGVVSTAVYHERTFGPAYVVVGIDLR